ncbi:hypothetical protein BY458DRAFT_430667 [Sporodiniella umbellata]|nr:hypothetical protein BY458DRAFT_430667 [Sporodiniella umbellata]
MTTQAVNRLSETTVPVVVCSTIDDSSFMVECIQAGAADYVLYPLRPDVIKTLFLVLYRHQRTSLYRDSGLVYSSTTLSTSSVMSPTTPTSRHSLYLPDNIQERMKHLITKDINKHKEILQRTVSSWDFSPLKLSQHDLIHSAVIMLNQVFLLPDMQPIDQEQLYEFIIDLSSLYHDDNPYHNFSHAVDVLQCIYYFLCQIGLLSFADPSTKRSTTTAEEERILKSMDIFALLIAAIGHDTGHPGVNNTFLHGFDMYLGGVYSQQYKEFRKLVITSILATDMSLHCDYVTKIKEQNKRLMDCRQSKDWDEARINNEKLLFCSGLIKCADISNVARPFPRAFEWAQVLVEEFSCQGDLERELGLPVLPMNDRSKIVLEDSQIGFIKFIALGLFESIHGYVQGLSFPVEHIKKNLAIWENRKQQATSPTPLDEKEYRLALNHEAQSEYPLPAMPPVAMTNMSHVYPKETNLHYPREVIDDEWNPAAAAPGSVYCQCVIQ